MDYIALDATHQAIRLDLDMEHKIVQHLQAAYGKKLDSDLLAQSQKDVTEILGEKTKSALLQRKIERWRSPWSAPTRI